MTESTGIQQKTLNYLLARGAYRINITASPHQEAGIPDILVCYKGMFIALETKLPGGRVRPAQKIHLLRIREAGGIGEIIHGIGLVQEILYTIDQCERWEPRYKF